MIEIMVLLVLVGKIGNMARRRDRNPSLFGLFLMVCWFSGEAAGATLGYTTTRDTSGQPNMLMMYGLALGGAVVGGSIAFLIASTLGPVGGVWRDISTLPVRHSRVHGACVGGVAGGVIGALVVYLMYGSEQTEGNLPLVLQAFLVVGFLGALLGMVSGVQKK